MSSSSSSPPSTSSPWKPGDTEQVKEARALEIWPLDEHNAVLLNEVHPRGYDKVGADKITPHEEYDLIAIGAGAGGLVSSRQSARRGAKSAMISEYLAGGDCLNVGCVPSKAVLRSAKAVAQVRKSAEMGVIIKGSGPIDPSLVTVDFTTVMERLRRLRATIAPADSHAGSEKAGAHVFQGRGRFTGPNTVEVNSQTLKFRKCVIATGGRPKIPGGIQGLADAPYTTNENLFNLEALPPRMVVLGAGVIALEMAQSFALFGSQVTVINRSSRLLDSSNDDTEAAELLEKEISKDGVTFLHQSVIDKVETVRDEGDEKDAFPLMRLTIATSSGDEKSEQEIECECLLVAAGRTPNIEDLGLDKAGVEYREGAGIVVNDLIQSKTNPAVYAVGDCVADVPRLTHMSGEMAKMAVQNALAGDDWHLSSLVVPATMYTEPEFATVGVASQEQADAKGIEVDVYRAGLEHNDRAILESYRIGFAKIVCKKGTDEIIGGTIVAERAGEMINEVSLAIKNKIGLYAVGRNIHCYPTIGEAVQTCGVQYINSKLPQFD